MAIWTQRQRQLIADAEDECEREDAADNKPNDIRDRILARLQAITDDQIDALITRALEGSPSYLRLVLQLAGASLKERDVRTPVKGARLIIIEPTQEELDEYAATHQPVCCPGCRTPGRGERQWKSQGTDLYQVARARMSTLPARCAWTACSRRANAASRS